MGAWGTGSFDNDDALDWAHELEEARDHAILEKALSEVVECDGYLEADTRSNAIAAAEVIAAAKGCPSPKLPDPVGEYLSRVRTSPSPELSSRALRALERVRSDSELKELWEDSGSLEEWERSLTELEARLR